MNCLNCNAEWTLPATSTVILKNCPFCGAPLSNKEVEVSLEDALLVIYQQIGDSGFQNDERLLGCFMDFAPSLKKEQKMLSLFVKCGGNTLLLNAKDSSKEEANVAAEKIIYLMMEELMAEEHCRRICDAYCRAIGCNLLSENTNEGAPSAETGSKALQTESINDRNLGFKDKTLVCRECGNEFVFSANEQEFYAERGFQNEPQRCKACRDARKNNPRGPRALYYATCAACGRDTRIPFEPKADRPVFCSECFEKMKATW